MGSPGPVGESGCDAKYGYTGSPGESGTVGMGGLPGPPGIPGDDGSHGEPGHAGVPGFDGLPGLNGQEGQLGMCGPTGDSGPDGKDGNPGEPGETGLDGTAGQSGRSGQTGETGNRGVSGRPGKHGKPGPPGPDYLPCNGECDGDGVSYSPGKSGVPGRRGKNGKPGPEGSPGQNNYRSGQTGLPGQAGLPGKRGLRGDSASYGFILTQHSQNSTIPYCPDGSAVLWTGYSYLFGKSGDLVFGQDMGQSTSCMKYFNQIPFIRCTTGQCNYANSDDSSYWLTTDTEKDINQDFYDIEIKAQLSRCSVCEVQTKPVTLHSQDNEIPECPSGYASLWAGYSFVSNLDIGENVQGQSLSSPGSCMKSYIETPYITCDTEKCSFDNKHEDQSAWLSAIENDDDECEEKRDNVNVSRCQVCIHK